MKGKTKKKNISWLWRCKQKIKEEHPIIMTYYRFYKKMGYFCHLRHPRTFNEKIQYLKIFYYPKNPLITQCADKYAVRKFISEKGYENLLVPLIGCWDSVEAVDFDSLPDRFVIKCNHGSGYNILCHDKRSFDKINQGGGCYGNGWRRTSATYVGNCIIRIFQGKSLQKNILVKKYMITNSFV